MKFFCSLFGPVQICVSHANVIYIVHLAVCNAIETLGKTERNSSIRSFLTKCSVLVLEMPLAVFLRGVNEKGAEFLGACWQSCDAFSLIFCSLMSNILLFLTS